MSEPLKVFEYAKQIGMEPLALMDKLREWKLPVKSHMASLNEGIITEIESRLSKEASAQKKATKASATKKKRAPAKKKAKAKTLVKKTTTAKKVADLAPAPKVVAKKRTVIRRRAAAATPPAAAASPSSASPGGDANLREEGVASSRSSAWARALPKESEEATLSPPVSEERASLAVAASPSPSTAATPPPAAAPLAKPKPRETTLGRNIVGRMDLKRVQNLNDTSSSRSQKTSPRNIRTGFVAMPMDMPLPVDTSGGLRDKDRAPKKKPAVGPPAAAGKEPVVQTFAATEFRKREVIFQPKKKRVGLVKGGKKTQLTTPKASKRVIQVHDVIKVSDLAQRVGVKAPLLVKKLISQGVMAQMNSDLDFDTVSLVVSEFGFEAQNLHMDLSEKMQKVAFGDVEADPVPPSPCCDSDGACGSWKDHLTGCHSKCRCGLR